MPAVHGQSQKCRSGGMNDMNRKSLFKKLIAGVATVAMVVSCVVAMPKTAEAATEYTIVHEEDDGVTYISNYQMKDYWKADSKTAPTMPGYFFGGWYTTTDNQTFTAVEGVNEAVEGAVAKFVPSYVMSVKVQNEANTTANNDVINEEDDTKSDRTSIRVVSAVDSDDYQKVGFTILLNNWLEVTTKDEEGNELPLETTKGYAFLWANGEKVYPDKLFGAAAEHLMVWRLDDIADANDGLIINITPYWITADGTKVEGLTKYAHVEDGYKKLVNIPINLCDDAVKMAAGLLEMTYASDNLEVYGVEYGLFDSDKMAYSDKGGSIKFVGNVEVEDGNIAANGIYVNVRFSLKEGVAEDVKWKGTGVGDFLTFEVSGEQFCDWDEKLCVDDAGVSLIDAWDIQY